MNMSDGESTIVATTGCAPDESPPCNALAETFLYDINGDGGDLTSWGKTPDYQQIAEADIVFFRGNPSWFWDVRTSTNWTAYDVAGTTTHESGHAFGFAHTQWDVMTPSNPGQNVWRYPTGDDTPG